MDFNKISTTQIDINTQTNNYNNAHKVAPNQNTNVSTPHNDTLKAPTKSNTSEGDEKPIFDIRDDIYDDSRTAFQEAIQSANKILLPTGREFEYKVHEKTHRILVKVVDTDSREIIKELPPEKELDALAKMWELTGILVDKKG